MYAIGTLLKSGGLDTHLQLVALIKTSAETAGWTTLRYTTGGGVYEWIGRGPGLSGTEQIFCGVKSYQNVSADLYNLNVATFVGYVPGNSFETQPGGQFSGVPAHNNAIMYYLAINAQRIVAGLKVGTPVYTSFYIGKYFPYARPGEFPSPLACGGLLQGAQEVRFSATTLVLPYYGSRSLGTTIDTGDNLRIRDQAGNWILPWVYPFSNRAHNGYSLAATGGMIEVPAGIEYQLEPLVMGQVDASTQAFDLSRSNIYGELDGVVFCSGFNNGPENVIQTGGSSVVNQTGMTPKQAVDAIAAVGGQAYVMIQNLSRTTWRDYVALKMTT